MSGDTIIEVPPYPEDPAAVGRVLRCGEVEVRGRMPWSSNATFLCELRSDEGTVLGVYKPERGERPLWDFPPGLWKREIAAHELSAWLGWDLVPLTVARPDAPAGPGSMQLFVPFDVEAHYFTVYETGAHHDALRRLCAFDIVTNATDRKGGHVLLGFDGAIAAIDNGLTFHTDFKLRTVIWEFAAEALPSEVVEGLERLLDGPPEAVTDLLDDDEVDAMVGRARALLASCRFPVDATGQRYPWPLV